MSWKYYYLQNRIRMMCNIWIENYRLDFTIVIAVWIKLIIKKSVQRDSVNFDEQTNKQTTTSGIHRHRNISKNDTVIQ